MNQYTLKKSYTFQGKGLHSGKVATMIVKPAPVDTGVIFRRVDISEDAVIAALAENVSSTARSTTITSGTASVSTVEHLLSALTGLGIDNATVDIDNVEVPILDGSAKPYIDAILADGTLEQDAPRRYVELKEEILIEGQHGSRIRIVPADSPRTDALVDFNSRVVGRQHAIWEPGVDYATEVGNCRTFVFFHELEILYNNNLVKGGDVDNAIVIVENPVTQEQVDAMTKLFNQRKIQVTPEGYLSNIQLRFPNECARHKLMDLIGDMRLCGGFLKAHVYAEKPGHTVNTNAAKAVRAMLK
ncbi:MAG: UDP-3-O-acyl-N-acetylglucosamine deacetylase [Bacteroidales bacterium]|nr:UDP-3-O-acyl-N-acetylglucosamine deacetylase [Bacteroidales bacterium]